MITAPSRFVVPRELAATTPPEARGVGRDQVRLLVSDGGGVTNARFAALASFLEPGDVLVVNTSATIPAAVDARRGDGRATTVHFSTPLDNGRWLVELRASGATSGRVRDARRGELVRLPAGVQLKLLAPYPDLAASTGSRLWRASTDVEGGMLAYLHQHGRPITYGYVNGRWPLEDYQSVFSTDPGSAEMPSAGRPFTTELVTRLVASGVVIVPLVLHAGVSSLEKGEAPLPERFSVPAATAEHVSLARRSGRRVIAVGTTVVRALETVGQRDGSAAAGTGWTDLVLGPRRPARVVSGLITGFHEPDASHLLLLEAMVGADVLWQTYEAALAERYLWHEFGDTCLLLSPNPTLGP